MTMWPERGLMWKQPWLLIAASIAATYLLVLLLQPAWHPADSSNVIPTEPAFNAQNLSSHEVAAEEEEDDEEDLSLQYVMSVQFANLTMLALNQYRMSDSVCLIQENMTSPDSRWGFEKLVYRDMQQHYVKGSPKYAVQGRGVFATGVHTSQKELGHMDGEIGWAWFVQMRYYHYHNTISKHEELCAEYKSNTTDSFSVDDTPFKLDTSMDALGDLVKQFEKEQIGDLLPA